jgi:hypothetical protein
MEPSTPSHPMLVMDKGLENTWFKDFGCSHLMTGVATWFSNLTHLLSCVSFLWDLACGFSMCLPCVDGHSFSHSMITHEPFMRFDGFLDSFSCGLGRVREHAYRASLFVHDFNLVILLLVLLMLVPRESLAILF